MLLMRCFNEMRQRPFCLWMQATHLTLLSVSLPYITFIDCVPLQPQLSSIHTGLLLSFLSMVRCSTPVKASLKETPSLCQCMHLQQFPLLRSYSVIWLMLVKCGMQMMPLLLGKSLDYVSGGVNYPHKVPSMATLPMPPKRGWSQK